MAQISREDLVSLFQATFSPDRAIRDRATETLQPHQSDPDFLGQLFTTCIDPSLDLGFRQAAIIFIKNSQYCSSTWTFPPSVSEVFRKHIIAACVQSYGTIVAPLLLELLLVQLFIEFPEKWPTAADEALGYLGSDDIRVVAGILPVVHRLLNVARFWATTDPRRMALHSALLPRLIAFLSEVVGVGSVDVVAACVIKNCTKAMANFGSSLPATMADNNCALLQQYCTILPVLFKDIVPRDAQDSETQTQLHSMRKWILRYVKSLVRTLISEEHFKRKSKKGKGKAKPDPEKEKHDAVSRIVGACSNAIAPLLMQLLSLPTDALPTKLRLTGLHTLQPLLEIPSVYALLTPVENFMAFFNTVLFPLFAFTEEEREIWEDDPRNFTTSFFSDLGKDLFSVRSAAAALLRFLLRAKKPFMDKEYVKPVLEYLHQSLTGNASEPIRIEAAIFALESILDLVSPEVLNVVLNNSVQVVIAHLSHDNVQVRYRATSLAGELTRYIRDWTVGENFANLSTILQTLCINFSESQPIPLRAMASVSIDLISNVSVAKSILQPHVKDIVKLYLSLFQEVNIDVLGRAVSNFMASYPDELAPYAVDVTARLLSHFTKLANETSRELEPNADDEATEAQEIARSVAIDVMKGVSMIIHSLQTMPEIVRELETMCIPIIDTLLADKEAEFLEEAMGLAAELLFARLRDATHGVASWSQEPVPVSLPLWVLYYRTAHQGVHSEEVITEYATRMIPVFDNFLSCDPRTFVTGITGAESDAVLGPFVAELGTPLNAMLKVMEAVFGNPLGTHLAVIPKLTESLLHYSSLQGPLLANDPLFPALLDINLRLLRSLKASSSSKLLMCIWCTIGDFFSYSAQRTVECAMAMGADVVRDLFQAWFTHLTTKLGRVRTPAERELERTGTKVNGVCDDYGFDRKMQVLGLIGLLHYLLTLDTLPELFNGQSLRLLCSTAVQLVCDLHIIQSIDDASQLGSDYDEDDDSHLSSTMGVDDLEDLIDGNDEDDGDGDIDAELRKAVAGHLMKNNLVDSDFAKRLIGGDGLDNADFGSVTDESNWFSSPMDDTAEAVQLLALFRQAGSVQTGAASVVLSVLQEVANPREADLAAAAAFAEKRIQEVKEDRAKRMEEASRRVRVLPQSLA